MLSADKAAVSWSFIHWHTTSKKSPENWEWDDSAEKASEYDLKFDSYIHNIQFPNYKNFSKNVKDALDFSDLGVPLSWESDRMFPNISSKLSNTIGQKKAYTVKKTTNKKFQEIMKMGYY